MANYFPNKTEIEARQLAQLRAMIREIVPGNEFYTQRLEAAGITPGVSSLDAFSQLAPFTTKQELVEDHEINPPYGSNLSYPLIRYTRFNQTSGMTGTPLRWLDTPESWDWMLYNLEIVLTAAGVQRKDRAFFPFSFGPYLGFWSAFGASARMGCLCIPGGGMSSIARAKAIIATEATMLCATPTYTIRLAQTAIEEGIDLTQSKVKLIVVAGEPGGSLPATRNKIEQLWPGSRVFDHHGMTEVGPVTFECPKHPGILHIIEQSYYAEVVEPNTNNPSEPGQMGELILTTLGRTGSPVLRYRTGDIVKRMASGQCDCGRYDMRLEGGILGRTDDMITIRGVNIFPTAVETVISSFNEIAEHRVEIRYDRSMPGITVIAEQVSTCKDAVGLARQLEKALYAAFSLRVPVSVVESGSLDRFELKAKRWIKL